MAECKMSTLIWQLEYTKTQKLHVQACIVFKEPVTLKAVRMRLGGNPGHLVPVFEDNGCENYCMKEATRVSGPFCFML